MGGSGAQGFVGGDDFRLARDARGSEVESVEGAKRNRRGLAITRGHDVAESGLNCRVDGNDPNVARGYVLIQLAKNLLGSLRRDLASYFFAESNPVHFQPREAGGDDHCNAFGFPLEVARVRLLNVELSKSGRVPITHALFAAIFVEDLLHGSSCHPSGESGAQGGEPLQPRTPIRGRLGRGNTCEPGYGLAFLSDEHFLTPPGKVDQREDFGLEVFHGGSHAVHLSIEDSEVKLAELLSTFARKKQCERFLGFARNDRVF